MAANRQKKAQAEAKARAKVRRRKQERDQYRAKWEHDYNDRPPVLVSMTDSPGDVRVLGEAPGVEKMSGVLLDFIEPWQAECRTAEELLTLARLGALAWNATLMPPKLRDKMLRELFASVPPEGRVVVAALVERKLTEFPGHDRFMIDVDLRDGPTGQTLVVMSSLTPPEE